jgi:hypothetical protein
MGFFAEKNATMCASPTVHTNALLLDNKNSRIRAHETIPAIASGVSFLQFLQ